MNSVLRFSTPYSEPWVAWVLLALLILLLLADLYQRGILVGSFRSITAAKDRESIFSEVARTTAGSITIFIYEAGIVAMVLYAILFREGTFSFLNYLYTFLLVCAFTGIKYSLMWLTSYIFFDKNAYQAMVLHFTNLNAVVCILLYLPLLFILFAPFVTHTAAIVILSVIAFFALIIWLLKAFRLFFNNLLAGVYIFLYLCTLEIVPLAGLIFIIRQIVI